MAPGMEIFGDVADEAQKIGNDRHKWQGGTGASPKSLQWFLAMARAPLEEAIEQGRSDPAASRSAMRRRRRPGARHDPRVDSSPARSASLRARPPALTAWTACAARSEERRLDVPCRRADLSVAERHDAALVVRKPTRRGHRRCATAGASSTGDRLPSPPRPAAPPDRVLSRAATRAV